MIKEVRVDDRLIHGQTALTWPKALNVTHIVVVNDQVSHDKSRQMTLKMAVPPGIKVLVRSVDSAIEFFKKEKAQQVDIMVITSSVKDADTLVRNLKNLISRVNIANVGRFDGVDNSKKTKLMPSILVTEKELDAVKDIIDSGINTVHQIIPDDKVRDFKKIFKNI
ncbi:PTS sugar transporter subunit IIB [Lactobacillus sp. ESL0791]|uniref:PTS sugar transporter subunit IIB n=1 Tax=Lactobacillus sp. ESL0791 TaxID=2983234 RepID=UPI0023F6F68B|nr:PTS sugar transporter subunit IIB [Lactobacillus sp. ESL0791]MDF7637851.1 PTS sugar transporter subunit IIB [Lactobacillus sp. ESL0791]